jgi:hypothetical protein
MRGRVSPRWTCRRRGGFRYMPAAVVGYLRRPGAMMLDGSLSCTGERSGDPAVSLGNLGQCSPPGAPFGAEVHQRGIQHCAPKRPPAGLAYALFARGWLGECGVVERKRALPGAGCSGLQGPRHLGWGGPRPASASLSSCALTSRASALLRNCAGRHDAGDPPWRLGELGLGYPGLA